MDHIEQLVANTDKTIAVRHELGVVKSDISNIRKILDGLHGLIGDANGRDRRDEFADAVARFTLELNTAYATKSRLEREQNSL